MNVAEPASSRWFAPPRRGVRPEIQALRAVAVMMVVLYHLWPNRLPGGYAGVDVFFVISGYLITAHLLREVERTGGVALASFWARRARRLLPASLLVVVVSAIATLLFVPRTFWSDFFRHMGGAIFYVENWLLAGDAVDYLAAESNASPVQHYWSLSAEEQFYLIWPLLIVAALWIARRSGAQRRAIAWVLATVTLGSLVMSIVMTSVLPSAAYFITPTRAWEFGIGGLLALVPAAASPTLRATAAWVGAAGIVATAFLYDGQTPFPGWHALLPVLATAAVIWAGTTSARGSLAHLARLRPVQYLGDISYSLYLWHWPPIVVLPYVLGRDMTFWELCGVLALTIVLADLTKRFVEDPVRSAGVLTSRAPRVSLYVAAAAMVVALVVPAGGWATARAESEAAAVEVERFDPTGQCVGADALLDPSCEGAAPVAADDLVPAVSALKEDTADAYECYTQTPEDGELRTCSYGSTEPDATRVALVGDSHAATLIPALKPHLVERGWRLDTYVARGCTWTAGLAESDCAEYRDGLIAALPDYDIVLTTTSRSAGAETEDAPSARAAAWGAAIDAGVEVVAITDNPRVLDDMVDCVAEHPDAAAAGTSCVMPRERAVEPADPILAAAEREPRAGVVRMNDAYCRDDGCPMVAGGVVVYRDAHHLTVTYARSVADVLLQRIDAALAAEG
ncbi:acyltransferase family protein [Microbacterium marinilacus]|uniref:Acyltransferase family protein n=2 Tax=Microbacterium marinilacus TaxID=415209 RepID=A0ABP7BD82_9MICO|nr:acyltransferase [Microbacterium marinilacus]